MREEKQTLFEMMVGIVGSTVLFSIIGAIFAPNKATFVLGVCFGGALAVAILLQLYRSLDKTLAMDERAAEKYAVRASIFRLVIMCVALGVGILLPRVFSALGILIGLLGLKVCAYTQPIVHKIIVKKVQ